MQLERGIFESSIMRWFLQFGVVLRFCHLNCKLSSLELPYKRVVVSGSTKIPVILPAPTTAVHSVNLNKSPILFTFSAGARSMTKQLLRGEALQWLQKNRDSDLKAFTSLVLSEAVQKNLGAYMESLKKK